MAERICFGCVTYYDTGSNHIEKCDKAQNLLNKPEDPHRAPSLTAKACPTRFGPDRYAE